MSASSLKTFFSASNNDLIRATSTPDGKWSVETLLADKKITCLASDPNNSNTIYIGTQKQGIYRSDDSGLTWDSCGMDGQFIKSLAVNKHDSNIIYLGTKPALMFISTDRADSWEELKGFRSIPNRWWWFSPAEPPSIRPYVIAIAPSPSEPDVLLAGIEFGAVVRSDDNGHSWTRHLHGALRDCHSLKYHSAHGERVYQAGGDGGGAAFSIDGGHSFQRKRQGLTKHYGIVCAADPENPEIWYVCVAASPFKAFGKNQESFLFRAKGKTDWQSIGWAKHPLPVTPTALVTIPDSPGHLYAGLSNGDVWHSSDYGDNWDKLPFNLGNIWSSLLIL